MYSFKLTASMVEMRHTARDAYLQLTKLLSGDSRITSASPFRPLRPPRHDLSAGRSPDPRRLSALFIDPKLTEKVRLQPPS